MDLILENAAVQTATGPRSVATDERLTGVESRPDYSVRVSRISQVSQIQY